MRKQSFGSCLFIVLTLTTSALIPAARAQTPPATGLAFWVKADSGVTTNSAGAVTQWNDQSGNGLNALQTDDTKAPKLIANAINNKPVIRFDGVNDFLNVATADPIAIVGDIATFAVIRVDDFQNYNEIWGKTAGAGGNIPAPTDYYLVAGSGFPQVYRGDGGGSFANVQGTRAVRANNYVVLGWQQEGTTLTHYLNGQTNGVGQIPDTIVPADAGTDLKIGTREDQFTRMKGDIAEILIYGQALSESDVKATIDYLRNKYKILNSPPIVSITSPANNASSNAPANVTVTVNAIDDDGTIARVDLYANGSLVGSATAQPYSFPIAVETAGAVTLTAIATDDKDATTTSAPIILNITGGQTPALQANSHLKLWLKGDAGITLGTSGAVVKWADQSGNSNDANLVEPDEAFAPMPSTLSGKPSVLFDGVDDYLDVADSDSVSITNEIASFFVVRFDDYATYRAVWGKTAGSLGNQPRPVDYYLLPGSGQPIVYRGYSTNIDGADVDRASSVTGVGGVPVNAPVLLGFQQQGPTMTHYLNGTPFGSGQLDFTAEDDDTPLRIGSRGDFVTKMKGDIAELLVYDAALDAAGLANLRQYLAGKYNLSLISPANTAPTVQLAGATQGGSYTVPTNITLTATANDTDGSIVRVEFLANGSPVATATNAPFSANIDIITAGEITLSAAAIDNLGARTVSAPITITATGAQPPPIPAAGLVLWLKGDKGITSDGNGGVSEWLDNSGNFNHARQPDAAKRPTLASNELGTNPALKFDGADDYLEVASSSSLAILGDITSFFVVKIDDYDGYRAVWAKTAGAGGNIPAPWDYWMPPNDGRPNLLHGNGSGVLGAFQADAPLPTDRYAIAGFDRAGSTVNHYLDQALNGTGTINGTGGDGGLPLRIGTRGDLFTKLKGGLAELVIYNRALTDQERTQVQSYLQDKWFTAAPAGPTIIATRGSGNTLIFSWPTADAGFNLQSSAQLGTGAQWANVTEPVVPSGNQNTVTVITTDSARFFRLQKP
jgi:hypothetical protein